MMMMMMMMMMMPVLISKRYINSGTANQCLSVCLVDQDHIDWKAWTLIAQTISPTSSIFVAQRPSTYSQENMAKFQI